MNQEQAEDLAVETIHMEQQDETSAIKHDATNDNCHPQRRFPAGNPNPFLFNKANKAAQLSIGMSLSTFSMQLFIVEKKSIPITSFFRVLPSNYRSHIYNLHSNK
jgi:hypothetical protein